MCRSPTAAGETVGVNSSDHRRQCCHKKEAHYDLTNRRFSGNTAVSDSNAEVQKFSALSDGLWDPAQNTLTFK